MPVIFKCRTSDAYFLKVLSDLLSNNLHSGCFDISAAGISIRAMDQNRKILIDMNLLADNFSLYTFNRPDPVYLGINLSYFHKMLKTIKKKDSLEIMLDTENPTNLSLKTIPKENNRTTVSWVRIQSMQKIDVDLPTGYSKPIIVNSSEFCKMTRDLNIGAIINISATKTSIMFSCEAGGIMKRTIEFGEKDPDDCLEKLVIYNHDFSTEQISKISKLSGLSSSMQIFSSTNLPLLFKSNIGNIGNISIYMKSKDQIDEENK
jgi:proliferating cell nuclear antigen PCNA